jgi:phosphate transport system protein
MAEFNRRFSPDSDSTSGDAAGDVGPIAFDRKVLQLRKRLVREATQAIGMLENSIKALWTLDADAARSVRREDDQIDCEEVAIEREAYELLALHHPFARDFRVVTFILKVNSDIERVADHASSIAKAVVRISKLRAPHAPLPRWPTALTELGHRVPQICHDLMRAVLNENLGEAKKIVESDEIIDQLERRLFDEAMEMMRGGTHDESILAIGMHVYRIGRELERIGDLMKDIAEELVYLATGEIVRHEGVEARLQAAPPSRTPGGG